MAVIRMLIEVYGGIVQNLYVADESPESQLEAVIVDWDYESYDGAGDCVVHAIGLDGKPTLACVSQAQPKPWRLLPSTGILDVLDRAGLASFGSPTEAASPPGEIAVKRRSVRGTP
jgi:hypothetical protein